jgi:hypothetical protein
MLRQDNPDRVVGRPAGRDVPHRRDRNTGECMTGADARLIGQHVNRTNADLSRWKRSRSEYALPQPVRRTRRVDAFSK